MTQQRWNDYYKGIAYQCRGDTVPQEAGAQHPLAPTGKQVAFQQSGTQQLAIGSASHSAFPRDAWTQQYQKEQTFSSDVENQRSYGTTLRFLALTFVATVCIILILLILAGLSGWPNNVAGAISAERKAKVRLQGKQNANGRLGGFKGRYFEELIVPQRVLDGDSEPKNDADTRPSRLTKTESNQRRKLRDASKDQIKH